MKTHVLFDFDGTLVDSAPAILSCFEQVLQAHQLRACRAIDESLIGPPLRQTLASLTGQSEPGLLDRLSASFKEIYDTQTCRTTPAYSGWEPVLHSLREGGFTLAIATNKRLIPTMNILDALGWREYFTEVLASDSHPSRYSDKTGMIASLLTILGVQPEQAVYVGDTVPDGQAAGANNVDFWPVAWGYGTFASEYQPLVSPLQLTERLQAAVSLPGASAGSGLRDKKDAENH